MTPSVAEIAATSLTASAVPTADGCNWRTDQEDPLIVRSYNADRSLVAVGAYDAVGVFDAANHQLVACITEGLEHKRVVEVHISPDSKLVALRAQAANRNHELGDTVDLWELVAHERITSYAGVTHIRGFSADSRILAVTICSAASTLCYEWEDQELAIPD